MACRWQRRCNKCLRLMVWILTELIRQSWHTADRPPTPMGEGYMTAMTSVAAYMRRPIRYICS